MATITKKELRSKIFEQWGGGPPFDLSANEFLPDDMEYDIENSYVGIQCFECEQIISLTPKEILKLKERYTKEKILPCPFCEDEEKKMGKPDPTFGVEKVDEEEFKDEETEIESDNELTTEAEEATEESIINVTDVIDEDLIPISEENASKEDFEEKEKLEDSVVTFEPEFSDRYDAEKNESEKTTSEANIVENDDFVDQIVVGTAELDHYDNNEEESVFENEIEEKEEILMAENPVDIIAEKTKIIEEIKEAEENGSLSINGYQSFEDFAILDDLSIAAKCVCCGKRSQYEDMDGLLSVVNLGDNTKYHHCTHCVESMYKTSNKIGIWRNLLLMQKIQIKVRQASDAEFYVVVTKNTHFRNMDEVIEISSSKTKRQYVTIGEILSTEDSELYKNLQAQLYTIERLNGENNNTEESTDQEPEVEAVFEEDVMFVEDENGEEKVSTESLENEVIDDEDVEVIEDNDDDEDEGFANDEEIVNEVINDEKTEENNDEEYSNPFQDMFSGFSSMFGNDNNADEVKTSTTNTSEEENDTEEPESGFTNMFENMSKSFNSMFNFETKETKITEEYEEVEEKEEIEIKQEESKDNIGEKKDNQPGIEISLGGAFPGDLKDDNPLKNDIKGEEVGVEHDNSWKSDCQDSLGALKKEKKIEDDKWYNKKVFLNDEDYSDNFNEFEDDVSLLEEFYKSAPGNLIREIEEQTGIPVKIQIDERTWDIPICDFSSGYRVVCLDCEDEGQMKSPLYFQKNVPFQFGNRNDYKLLYLYSDSVTYGDKKYAATKNSLKKIISVDEFDPRRIRNLGNNYALFYTDNHEIVKGFEEKNSPYPHSKPSNNKIALIAMKNTIDTSKKVTSRDLLKMMDSAQRVDLKDYNMYIVATARYIESPTKGNSNSIDYFITDYTELTATIWKDGFNHIVGVIMKKHNEKHPGKECNVILEIDRSCFPSPSLEVMIDNDQMSEVPPNMVGVTDQGVYYIKRRVARQTLEDTCRQDYRMFLPRTLMKRFSNELSSFGQDIRLDKNRKAFIQSMGFYKCVRPAVKTFMVSPLYLMELNITSSVLMMSEIDLNQFFNGGGVYTGGYDALLQQKMMISLLNAGNDGVNVGDVMSEMMSQMVMDQMMNSF